MSSSTNGSVAIEKARRLLDLYSRRVITDTSVINGIAEIASPDNIDEVLAMLPSAIRLKVRDWARTLPDPDTTEVVYWPLPRKTTLSFKKWLQEHEENEGIGNQR
jgi:hypothetical protein